MSCWKGEDFAPSLEYIIIFCRTRGLFREREGRRKVEARGGKRWKEGVEKGGKRGNCLEFKSGGVGLGQ